MGRDQTVKVHFCFKQHLGEQLNPENCHCRKWITYEEAEQKIADGVADWLILSRTEVASPDEIGKFSPERGRFNPNLKTLANKNFVKVCPLCVQLSESRKKLCKNCHGRGLEPVAVFWEELSRHQEPAPGGTIVMVGSADESGRFNLALHKKTPRVATLEGPNPGSGPNRLGHIVRAAIGSKYDQERVEEYGRINDLELYGKPQGAPLTDKTISFTLEPEDIPGDMIHDAQGRRYDYGECAFSGYSDGGRSRRMSEIGKPFGKRSEQKPEDE
jgi:hypothetical protein